MKTPLIILAVVVSLMLGGLYYQFLYPPSVMKNNTVAALQSFAAAVETQDRAKVGQTLSDLLTDDAKVKLEVSFSAINSANVRPMSQEMDKATFAAFIDNILFTVSDYHYRPKLEEFRLQEEGVAVVRFPAVIAADGPAFYSGVTLMMHFSGNAECTGEVVFTDMQPKLRLADCKVLLRSVTKTDSAGDMIKKADEIRQQLNPQAPVQP